MDARGRRGSSEPDPSDVESRLRRLAWLADDSIPLPGGRRIGLDGLVGLVPVVGDLAGLALSAYVIVLAWRAGASLPTVARMLANVAVEAVVGVVPVAGDLFDFAWKANARNVRLLERHARDPRHSRRRDGAFVAALVGVLIATVAAVVGLVVLAVRSIGP